MTIVEKGNNGMTDATPLARLADHIAALTEPLHHVESYELRSIHVPESKDRHGRGYLKRFHPSEHLSLLDQLRECHYDRAQTAQEAANREAVTVPHIDLDAVDRLIAISDAVNEWREKLDIESRAQKMAATINRAATGIIGLFPSMRMVPKDVLRAVAVLRVQSGEVARRFDLDLSALTGKAAENGPQVTAELLADVGRWVTWCRVFAGWETPPARPRARCPHCDAPTGIFDDAPSGLRVRWDIRSAVCLSCNVTWSDGDGCVPIEQLGKHIGETSAIPLSAEQVAALVDHGKGRADQNRGGKS